MKTGKMQATNQFFSTPAGKKLARQALIEGYISLGVPAPESLPKFTYEEENELGKFKRSPAGTKLLAGNGIATIARSPVVVKRVIGMAQSCART